jgi:hypothetical protein
MKKLFSLLFLCFVVSCSLTGPSISILDDSQCELPCWKGITPGETSHEEALQIVKGLDGIDAESIAVINLPWEIFNKRIWFYLYKDSSLTKEQTDGALYFIDDKVVALLLQRNIVRSFGDMVESVGEPETIISKPFVGGGNVVMAILPSKGIRFEFFAKPSDELQPETEIDNVMFFDTKYYEDLLESGMFSLGEYGASDTRKIMYPWKGYGNLQELYPPRLP